MIQKEQEEAIRNTTIVVKKMITTTEDVTLHLDIIAAEIIMEPEMIHTIDHEAFTEVVKNMKKDIDERGVTFILFQQYHFLCNMQNQIN